MYLVSIYFDEQTDKRIRQYINQIARRSGNTYMIDGNIPPHITISAFETNRESEAIALLEQRLSNFKQGTLQWAGVG